MPMVMLNDSTHELLRRLVFEKKKKEKAHFTNDHLIRLGLEKLAGAKK